MSIRQLTEALSKPRLLLLVLSAVIVVRVDSEEQEFVECYYLISSVARRGSRQCGTQDDICLLSKSHKAET